MEQRQLEQFAADGYLALRGFFAGSKLEELLREVERYLREVIPRMPAEQVFYEDKGDPATLKQLQQMGKHDDWFHQLMIDGPLPELAERVLGSPVVAKNLQYFNKPPGRSRATPPHQDGYYFMLDPCEAVTMWLALDEVDEENGCVRYVRGSQHHGMREHARTETLGFSQGIVGYPTEFDRANEQPVRARPGDLLVHDAMTIHRADANTSGGRSRRALGLIYYSERAQVDVEASEAYQQRLASEMKAAGKI